MRKRGAGSDLNGSKASLQRVAGEQLALLAFRQVAVGDGTFHRPAAVPAINSGVPAPLGLQAGRRCGFCFLTWPIQIMYISLALRGFISVLS